MPLRRNPFRSPGFFRLGQGLALWHLPSLVEVTAENCDCFPLLRDVDVEFGFRRHRDERAIVVEKAHSASVQAEAGAIVRFPLVLDRKVKVYLFRGWGRSE